MSGPFGPVNDHTDWISDGPFGIWRHVSGKIRVVNVEPGYMIDLRSETTVYDMLDEAFEAAEKLLS